MHSTLAQSLEDGDTLATTSLFHEVNQELFRTLITAQIKTEMRQTGYNEERPHSTPGLFSDSGSRYSMGLGYRTPVEYRNGIRIPLLEHGRSSTYQEGKTRRRSTRKSRVSNLSVVQT